MDFLGSARTLRELSTIAFTAILLTGQSITLDRSTSMTIAVLVILVLSLAFHEVAHAWVAWKCGDSTAKDLGRITLDPLPHIDLWWTIIMPTIMWYTMGFVFGGAKPVPVAFHKLRNPYRDMALVAIAGPFTNFLIAIFLGLVLKIVSADVLGIWSSQHIGYAILWQGLQLNLLLAVFNLIPIPPLDGSRILTWLLPESLRANYVRLESFGLLLVMLFVFGMPQISRPLLLDSMSVMHGWVESIVSLGGIW